MDRVWLYIGGMILAVATVGYLVINSVRNTIPPYQ
jgi:type IV secretory pathway TrbF-like protein